ncbi:MAG: hypothetical protein M3Y39_15390, partial [Chloroflexota bacterium]|nr:hypothetical protein [Chloroflexota bacterium]
RAGLRWLRLRPLPHPDGVLPSILGEVTLPKPLFNLAKFWTAPITVSFLAKNHCHCYTIENFF